MAGPAPLSELLKINDMNLSDVEGISDLLQGAPLLAALWSDFASNGTQHKYLKETKAPVVGFRAINAGREHDHSADTPVTIDLKLLDASFHVDQGYADEFKNGRDAWLARESIRHIRASFTMAEKQLIQGQNAGEAGGFTGLQDASTINHLNDPMVVPGGATTGALSSVYLIRSVSDLTDVVLITGNEGNISVENTYQQMMPGSVANTFFNAYVTPIYSHLALQVGHIRSLGRICNLDDGSNTLDDAKIAEAISRFDEVKPPTHLVMNRRSLAQLQKSRTATNATGAPAPFPTEAFGIPIVLSGGVSNAETALINSV